MLISWFILSLLSVFALATAELTQQYLLNIKNGLNERTSAVLTFLFQSLLVLPIILLTSYKDQFLGIFDSDILPRVIIAATIASVGMVFYLKSFKVKNISISTVFTSGSAIVSTALGIIFLGESVMFVKFLGIFLIMGAIMLLNFRNVSLEKNHYYGLLAGLMFGITYTIDKSVVAEIEPLIYIFWAFILVSLLGFLFNPRDVINSVRGKSFNSFLPIFVSGLGYFLYNLFTFTAYKLGGEVGKIDAINNSQVFLIILFEFFVLKNTKSVWLKLSTAIIAATGVILLGLN